MFCFCCHPPGIQVVLVQKRQVSRTELQQGGADSVHFYFRKWKRRVNVLQKQHSVQQMMHISYKDARQPLSTRVWQLSTHPGRRWSRHTTEPGPDPDEPLTPPPNSFLLVRCRPRPFKRRYEDGEQPCKLSRRSPQRANRWVTGWCCSHVRHKNRHLEPQPRPFHTT